MNSLPSTKLHPFPGWSLCLAILVAGAILVRLAYGWSLNPSQLVWPDEIAYDKIAWNLAQTGHYEAAAYDSAPALPAFLAITYRVAGHNFRAARVAQAFFSGVLVLLTALVGATLFDRWVGFWAGVGIALYPQLIYLSGVFYAEHLFAVLTMGLVFCLVRWAATQHRGWLIGAGVIYGVAALCRPVGLAFLPAAALYVWMTGKTRRLPAVTLFVVTGVATILPWTIRNYATFHHFVPVSTGSGLHMWRGNNDLSRGDAGDRHLMPFNEPWKERLAEVQDTSDREAIRNRNELLLADLQKLDEVERDQLYGREGRLWLRSHPAQFVRLSINRGMTLYSAFSKTFTQNEIVSQRNKWIAAGSFYPVLVLGLAGLLLAWSWNRQSWIIPAVIGSLTLTYLPMTACTRFRLPMDPFWILLASVVLVSLARRCRPSRVV
jgi:4-amino-4-deoxy-L-arabinose transferase-like glycosyltransferase